MDVSPEQASALHPRPLPTFRATLQHLSPTIPLLPNTFATNRRYDESSFDFKAGWITRFAIRSFTVRNFGTMGEFRESLWQEAYDNHRPGSIDCIEHWVWILDHNTSSDVLAGTSRNRKWEYWGYANDDS